MNTTWGELKQMIENQKISDDTQIILKVRGNKTTDKKDQTLEICEGDNGMLMIKDTY